MHIIFLWKYLDKSRVGAGKAVNRHNGTVHYVEKSARFRFCSNNNNMKYLVKIQRKWIDFFYNDFLLIIFLFRNLYNFTWCTQNVAEHTLLHIKRISCGRVRAASKAFAYSYYWFRFYVLIFPWGFQRIHKIKYLQWRNSLND